MKSSLLITIIAGVSILTFAGAAAVGMRYRGIPIPNSSSSPTALVQPSSKPLVKPSLKPSFKPTITPTSIPQRSTPKPSISVASALKQMTKAEMFELLQTLTTEEKCKAAGGMWNKVGARPISECNLPTSDSGKICSDSSECQGSCIYDGKVTNRQPVSGTGKCSSYAITVGCQSLVNQGKIMPLMCAD